MTIKEIKNNYAVEQGFDSWEDLRRCVNFNVNTFKVLEIMSIHENAVIQLIQDELKRKIASKAETIDVLSDDYQGYGEKTYKTIVCKNTILNIENIL